MASELEIVYPTPDYPRQVRLDTVGNACNAKCLSCHRFLSQRKGTMSIDLVERIIADVSRWDKPLMEIVPVNYGEFFLYPHWFTLLKTIDQKLPHTNVVIPTNGSLLTKQVVEQLSQIRSIAIVNLSINAFYRETYEWFMGLPYGTVEQAHEHILRLRLLRPDIKVRISMVFDPSYQTDLEQEHFQRYWGAIGEVFILPAASCGREDNKPQKPVRVPCRSIFSDLVIGFDSKISSCCWDSNFSLPLDRYQGDLIKNWRSPELTDLRRIHNEKRRAEIDLCRHCSFA